MRAVERGAQRTAKPDIFISYSSRDKSIAMRLAATLNLCAVDTWFADWELEPGEKLAMRLNKALEDSRYIAILITKNYNKTVWTKLEYVTAQGREEKEKRTVMLPLIMGGGRIPEFIEEKIYVDLRNDFFSGIFTLSGMVHDLSMRRISQALSRGKPDSVNDVWRLLKSQGCKPYAVLGKDDFDEVVRNGGKLIRTDYAIIEPYALSDSPNASDHIKTLLHELF